MPIVRSLGFILDFFYLSFSFFFFSTVHDMHLADTHYDWRDQLHCGVFLFHAHGVCHCFLAGFRPY